MNIRRLFIIFLSVLIAVAIAGCGGSSVKAPSEKERRVENQKTVANTKIVDPSLLITRQEAEEALGEPVKEATINKTGNAMGQVICLYNAVSEESSRFIQISVIQTQGMSGVMREQAQSAITTFRTTKQNTDPMKEVPGLADDAFWGTPGLHILKGDVYLNIAVGNTNDPANLELAKKLAKIALSRL
ncbi:MAG: hypothetical protein ACYC56_00840 [Candidatus Aquicultor sp.]